MIGVLLLICGVALILYAFSTMITNHTRYFEERNLKSRSTLSAIKDIISMFFSKTDIFKMIQKGYNHFPDER